MKTEIYNLIILDESGSMGCVWQQTINGCNEIIETIQSAQKQNRETQDHYVSIYAFHSGEPSRYILKNEPADSAKPITHKDYRPSGGTPLLDAVGSTLIDLQAVVNERNLAVGSVTIITDGEENSSKEYNLAKLKTMIKDLKERGWNFNFIGANINVMRTASSMNIDNAMEFIQDTKGTKKMFSKFRGCSEDYFERLDLCMSEPITEEELAAEEACENKEIARKHSFWKRMKKAGDEFFD